MSCQRILEKHSTELSSAEGQITDNERQNEVRLGVVNRGEDTHVMMVALLDDPEQLGNTQICGFRGLLKGTFLDQLAILIVDHFRIDEAFVSATVTLGGTLIRCHGRYCPIRSGIDLSLLFTDYSDQRATTGTTWGWQLRMWTVLKRMRCARCSIIRTDGWAREYGKYHLVTRHVAGDDWLGCDRNTFIGLYFNHLVVLECWLQKNVHVDISHVALCTRWEKSKDGM
jgi:hypothetical protein